MKVETRINLGDQVTDKVNGHKGTATGVQVQLNGCIQFLVESSITKENPKGVDYWIDEQRLKVTKQNAFQPEKSKADLGGSNREHHK